MQVFGQYRDIENPVEKEKQLCKILPLFCKNCEKYSGAELASKFPEAFEFAESVSQLLVRHVTQLAQGSNTIRSVSVFATIGCHRGNMTSVTSMRGRSKQ